MADDITQTLKALQQLVDESAHFADSHEEEEKDVFSLGGRGHYENPISDLLAFFLNPQEQHKFGDLFIVSLFECLTPENYAGTISADANPPKVPIDLSPPDREVCTNNGNRIDLLIKSKDEIIIIENKIYHWLANPLGDYRDYVEGQEEYAGKIKYLIVLGLSLESPADFAEKAAKAAWNSYYVSYRKFLDALNKNVGSYLLQATNNKWLVIMREFQLNLERMMKVTLPLEQEKVNFVAKNIPGIISVQHLWNDYLGYIKQRIIAKFDKSGQPSVTQNTWGNDIALRFYYDEKSWRAGANGANLTVRIAAETGSYRFGIYLPGVKDTEVPNIHAFFNSDNKFDESFEGKDKDKGKGVWRRLWTKKEYDWQDLNSMFEEAGRIIALMNDYYKKG